MKRSEINRALRDMEKMIDRCSFKLPPFWDGISRILGWGILTRWDSPSSP